MTGLLARLALLASLIAIALIALAGPVYRYGGGDLSAAFTMMRFGVYAAAATAALFVLWLLFAAVTRTTTNVVLSLLALVLAGGAAFFPLAMMAKGQSAPAIHDITTDSADPPLFVAIAPLRKDAPNGVDYKAADNADKQKEAYPDIQPLIAPDVAPADMFKRAEAAARAMNWHIAAAGEGRIEATDTTPWWGFKDDIVIRIRPEGEGSRLDIRSMSRVGKSDLGKNADRIRKFLALVREEETGKSPG